MDPPVSTNSLVKKQSVLRCMDWLQTQNSLEPKKLSLQNKNDIQFIIQTNADRKKFLLAAAEDDGATVPDGVGEPVVEPKKVPLRWLRVDELHLECDWQACHWVYNNYEMFQKHVKTHIPDIHVIENSNSNAEYACLWDTCGHKTQDCHEMVRHINYHGYHAHLMAIGFNGRATLDLARCTKDSTKRSQLPNLPQDHMCMWTGCQEKFNAIQALFDHVKRHVFYTEKHVCSWGGCGATFPRRVLLTMHLRSHTGERVIACYHCGHHFATNVKLVNHLKRQSVPRDCNFQCWVCGTSCASEYLVREHARQHVSAYACSLCDMSATTPAALAQHVRYRHLKSRLHACPHCDYKAVTKTDLRKHIPTHNRGKPNKKRKTKNQTSDDDDDDDDDLSDDEIVQEPVYEPANKKKKVAKKYACHMCPEKQMKIFSRGTKLTTHLVKKHGAQWPFGHSRFRYQISEDGMYRLTTTRYEILEVSKKIVDGTSGPQELLNHDFDFEVKPVADATETTPQHFEVVLKGDKSENSVMKSENCESEVKSENVEVKSEFQDVEIEISDIDHQGNIISKEVFRSDVVYK